MSVQRPLGATQAGTVEFTTRAREISRRATGSRVGTIALCGIVVTGALIATAAANTDSLLPESVRPIPRWLAGPFGGSDLGLGVPGLIVVLVAMFAAYAIALRTADRLSARAVLMTIAALHTLVLLGPPLLSTDVFSYQAYARMGALYGLNPYLTGPHAIALDPLYPFVGAKWVGTPSAYGPVFTALSYSLARLSIASSVFAYKSIAAIASLATVVLVWHSARLRRLDPVKAAALVGLNPLVVVYGVGGGHNDLLMLTALAAGIWFLLSQRSAAGGASIVGAFGVKLTAGLYLPFVLADRRGMAAGRRREFLLGAGVASALLAALALPLFGSGLLHLVPTIAQSQSKGDWHSIPGFISTRLGLGTIGHITGYVLAIVFVVVTVWLLRRVWRGQLDWIEAAGWATLAMLFTASSLLPWYVAWLMPFAALARDRRLWWAAIGMTGLVQAIQLLGYIPHGSSFL